MKRRIEPFEAIVLSVGVATILGVSVAQLIDAAPDLFSTYGGLIGGFVAAGGTIFAGWIAFAASRRQTQTTLEQEILLHNRQIAQALREIASSIDHETAVAMNGGNAIRDWGGDPRVDPNDIVTRDELPQAIAVPSAAWSAHRAIVNHCQMVPTISKALRGTCEHAHRMARGLYGGESKAVNALPVIERTYRKAAVDCAELKVISSFLKLNADAIADSREIEVSLRRLPRDFVEEWARFHDVRPQDMEYVLLEMPPELAMIEPQPHRSPPIEKSG